MFNSEIAVLAGIILIIALCLGLGIAVFSLYFKYLKHKKGSVQKLPVGPTPEELEMRHKILEGAKRDLQIQVKPGVPIFFRYLPATGIFELIVDLSLANTGSLPLAVSRLTWELWLSGFHVKSGSFNKRLELPGNATDRELKFNEVLQNSEIGDALFLNKEPSGYLEGVAQIETSHGKIDKKFTLLNLNFKISQEARDKMEDLDEESQLDGVTGMLPRKFLENNLQMIIEKSVKEQPLSFLMIDIDNFKMINDQHGHLAGDDVLRRVCQEIKAVIGDKGLCIRYGGDEFSIVLPNYYSTDAKALAEQIRFNIEKADFRIHDHSLPLTVSIGVATLTEKVDYHFLIKFADDVLRFSKQSGKNRVSLNQRGIRENLPPL